MPGHLSILCPTQFNEEGAKYKIMLIGEFGGLKNTLATTLSNYGFHIIHAGGNCAIDEIQAARPDGVLVDSDYEAEDPYDLCIKVKACKKTRVTPIVFWARVQRPEMMLCAFEAGASDYIRKDCEGMELIARIRTHIEMSQLQGRLSKNQIVLAKQLKSLNDLVENERLLSEKLAFQQAQMVQADKMASIGQLAAGVAHEINNPTGFVASNLVTLSKYIEDLKKILVAYGDFVDQGCRQNLDQAVCEIKDLEKSIDLQFLLEDLGDLIDESIEGTSRIRQIVSDMRDFSHVDSPELGFENVNMIIDKTLNVASNELKYKANIEKCYVDLPEIRCYGGKLGQVFLNLFVNAAHAMHESNMGEMGLIKIVTGVEKDHVWVEVVDNGCGIDKQNLDKIFNPFFTTKDVGKGTGLGLHLVYQIVKAHDGDVTVESEVGVGTTFKVLLPIAGPKVESEEVLHDAA